MRIYTKVDQYTIGKLKSEGKKRVDRYIFPTGPILVPVFFGDINIPENSFFRVEDGQMAMHDTHKKIDFGFKIYSDKDGPYVIPEMVMTFNSFIDSFAEAGLQIRSDSIFLCAEKILSDLGYIGKLVLAQGVEVRENGETYIYSINYAESLIIKDDYHHEEYLLSKIIHQEI